MYCIRLALFTVLALATTFVGQTGKTEKPTSPAAEALERLRSLSGEWEGTLEWSGARTGNGTVKATYRVISNQSVVLEHLTMNDDSAPSMTSMYHLDEDDLRMTHYCAAQNQPRLKATEFDKTNGAVKFSFVDGANLKSRPAHVEAVELRFLSPDRLVIRFTFDVAKDGQKAVEHIELKRVKGSA